MATQVPTTAPGVGEAETAAGPAAGWTAPIVPAGNEGALVLTFRDASWTEVKDGNGRVLVSQMIPGGQTRAISGVPPLDVVIGNSVEVSATYRGQTLDLGPVTQKNIARFAVE